MEKQNSFIGSMRDLAYDLTNISVSYVYDKFTSTFKSKTNEDFKKTHSSIKHNANETKLNVNSFGPSTLNLDLSKEKLFNVNKSKVNHTKKLIGEFNRKRKNKFERKRSLIINHFIPEDVEMEDMNPYYQLEEYKVLTKDGFVMTIFRINVEQEQEETQMVIDDDYFNTDSKIVVKKKSFKIRESKANNLFTDKINRKKSFTFKNNKQPILLQHGVVDSSDGWLCNKEEKCLPLVLASKGYDVWLGNSRGNYYSEEHLWLDYNLNKKEYYDFSFDQMGRYDLPSTIAKIQEIRRNDNRIILIGHSQGCASSLAGMSLNNDFYSQRVKLFIALAPVCKMIGLNSSFLKFAASSEVERLFYLAGMYSIGHRSDTLSYLSSKHLNNFNCKYDIDFEDKSQKQSNIPSYWEKIKNLFNLKISLNFGIDCTSFAFSYLTDGNSQEINDSNSLNKLLSHVPSGSSVKGIVHFKYNMNADNFRRFDYGRKINQNIYGTSEPPEYNIQDISIPTVILYGLKDKLVNDDDVGFIHSKMFESVLLVKTYNMGHLSFQVGKETKWINDTISFIEEYEAKN